MPCATCAQVAATEADVKRAQQRLAAVRAQERTLKTEEAQLLEQRGALKQRHAQLQKQVQQREAASAESQKQHDEVPVIGYVVIYRPSHVSTSGPPTRPPSSFGTGFAVGETSR